MTTLIFESGDLINTLQRIFKNCIIIDVRDFKMFAIKLINLHFPEMTGGFMFSSNEESE